MGSKEKKVKEKPLEKMTAKDLRELAKDIPDIVGAHGMNKDELISAIKKARGIEDKPSKKGRSPVRKLKKEIRDLKSKRRKAIEADDAKTAAILKRKIIRLKKQTRRAA